ncbi:hypothetical protein BEWA_005440 [Theileria equi strain WA]|uniref:Translation initiation factor IF-2 n=1 Tax=Theileria equi strain WA TaxID=1537102 RepID=L0B1K9_THEEQ|nr:hypothetical protein BEWA_005440 [Theileria equi strain WA]AFZ81136.1 hypothetical protein BEWA_005440 [Theileria equi strain WA]|eukprot:XP_004830802.1 hypothetical protein BEWA_005440 [Theileria equi strain WA]
MDYRYNNPYGLAQFNSARNSFRNTQAIRGFDELRRWPGPVNNSNMYFGHRFISPKTFPMNEIPREPKTFSEYGSQKGRIYGRDSFEDSSNRWIRFSKLNNVHWLLDQDPAKDWPGAAKLKPDTSYEGIIHRFSDPRSGVVLLTSIRVEASISSVDLPAPYCSYELTTIFRVNNLSCFMPLFPLEFDRNGLPKLTLCLNEQKNQYLVGERVFGTPIFIKRNMVIFQLNNDTGFAQLVEPIENIFSFNEGTSRISGSFKRGESVELEITRLPKFPRAIGYLVKLASSSNTSSNLRTKWKDTNIIPPKKEVIKIQTAVKPKEDQPVSSIKPVVKAIIPSNSEKCTISEFSNRIGGNLKQIMRFLFLKTNTPITSSQNIQPVTAKLVYNFVFGKDEYEINREILDQELGVLKNSGTFKSEDRPPVIALLGHASHGKTTLFNALCNIKTDKTNATQNIKAYPMHGNFLATLIDTPGLELFSSMRTSGIVSADMALVLVSADEGLTDKTIECINLCREHSLPFIIVVTKSDLASGTAIENIATQLADMDVVIEDLGGSTQLILVSFLKDRESSIRNILDGIMLQAAAHPRKIESKIVEGVLGDGYILECGKSKGLGFYSYLILKNGSAKKGNFISSSSTSSKIRIIKNYQGKVVDVGNSSDVLYVYGFEKNSVPNPGDKFTIYANEDYATTLSEHNKDTLVESMIQRKVSSQIEAALQELDFNEVKSDFITYIPAVLKCSAKGLIEPVKAALEKIQSVGVKNIAQYKVIHADIGNINLDDIQHFNGQKGLAVALDADINTTVTAKVKKLDIKVIKGDSVQNVLDMATAALDVLLGEKKLGECVGRAEILKLFGASKNRKAAGCVVKFGTIRPEFSVRIVRGDMPLYYGKISSLRHTTESASEVLESESCGITFVDFNDFQVGDFVETYIDE